MALGYSQNRKDFAAVGGSIQAASAGMKMARGLRGQRLDGVEQAATLEQRGSTPSAKLKL